MIWYAAAGLLLIVAWVFQLSLLAYATYVLLVVLLVSRWLARSWTENIIASREYSTLEAQVGQTIAVAVRVKNESSLAVAWLLMEDLLPRSALIHTPPNLQMRGERLQLAMLPAKSQRSMLYQLTCNRRGYYQVGPLLLETGDLFGLYRRHRVAVAPNFVLVLPKIVTLDGYEVSSKRPIGEVRMTYRLYEDPTRIAGVRRYMPGDPLNRVHWRATARTGVLHSKIYEPSTVAGATLLLDFHRDSYPRPNEPVRSELAITAAASIANALTLQSQQVGLVTNARDAADRIRTEGWGFDLASRSAVRKRVSMQDTSDRLRPVVITTKRADDQLPRILQTLGRLELTDGLDLPQLIAEAESRLPRDATVIAIVCTVTTQIALALQNLKRRGYAVTALVNAYDYSEFADAAAPLLTANIPCHHLRDEASVATVCRLAALR